MAEENTGAEGVHWDLSDLYPSSDALDQDLLHADREADAFAGRYRDRVANLSAEDLARALGSLEALQDRMGRSYAYAYLHWSTNTNDPARGALLQKVQESYTQTSKKLIFFDLEWAHLDDERARAYLEAEELRHFRHYLELQRLQKDYLLSEPEEKILSEKSLTGRGAWNRFFDETLGAARFYIDGEAKTEQETLSKLHESNRDLRRSAALALTEGLQKHERELTFVFNTILADKNSDDRLRGYPHWLSSRNLANEVSDETVDALIEAVTSRYDLVARYYRLKQKLLSLDELMDYDRYAPIGAADIRYTWNEARDVVIESYSGFHPEMGTISEYFFDLNWIDAAVAAGKRGGAFSHGTVPSAHPYILMNFTGKIRDVQTLAHELGHGVHQHLSRKQGVFQASTPLTTAEMASVFGEMLVFQRLLKNEEDAANKLAMVVGKIDDTIATVFRQVAMNRFEDRIHTARRTEGELTAGRFAELWLATQDEMFRGSVTLGEHYRHWWSYIPHFLHSPGYVYAYAFGELLVLALYAKYRQSPMDFPSKYITLLEAGGSDWPHELLSALDIDLTDPGFWRLGMKAIEDLIIEAEDLKGETENAPVS